MVLSQATLPDPNDTIVALSSAAGMGMRAIVRLSGRRALAITASICPEFHAWPGQLFAGLLRLPGFHATIPADLYAFVGAKTYTGQDMVEVHTIASAPVVAALVAECLNAGARAAEPGEFTMRAFLAGKLDLTRAEAVLGVIEAADRSELNHALVQMAGGLAQPLRELREELLDLLADVEAALDFADEDIQFVSADVLLTRLAKGLAYLTNLRRQMEQRSLGRRTFRVVLAGLPNAGKSSLFNALLDRPAALVSAESGTTRDYLQQMLKADGCAMDLIDTAGLSNGADDIERLAQSLGQEQAQRADLVLWCSACDEPSAAPQSHVECWTIATKADLAEPPPHAHATSTATGEGVAALRGRLIEHARKMTHSSLAPSLSRCKHHVEACIQHLRNAHALVIEDRQPELLALELRLTLDELGAMVGAVYTDDLLDRVFSRFCIGK